MTKNKTKGLIMIVLFALFMSMFAMVSIDTSYAAAKKIHLKKTTVSLELGKTYQQKLINEKGKTIRATKVKWRSSKKSISIISKKGVIKTKKSGIVKMSAKYKGKKYSFTVKVKKAHVKKATVSTIVGKTFQQKLLNSKGKTILATKVKWKSLKPSIATIDGKGKVTGVKIGTAIMSAKYYGDTYKFTVKVKPHNDSIQVDLASITLDIGEKKSVTVSTDKGYDITGEISNNNVKLKWGNWIEGTNDRKLNITGVSAGNSIVTVVDSNDKRVKATIKVKVNPRVRVNEKPISLNSPNEVKTVTVFLDRERELSADEPGVIGIKNGSAGYQKIVTCTFGEWDQDTKSVKMFVHGAFPGGGSLHIYDSNNSSVGTYVYVNVKGVIINSPKLPAVFNTYHDGVISASCKITGIETSMLSYWPASNSAEINITAKGVVTYSSDPSQSACCLVNYDIVDSSGRVVEDGYLRGYGVPGEKIELSYIYDEHLEPGTYSIIFKDYSSNY